MFKLLFSTSSSNATVAGRKEGQNFSLPYYGMFKTGQSLVVSTLDRRCLLLDLLPFMQP